MRRWVLILTILGLPLAACDSGSSPAHDEHASCVGCHSDYDYLEQIATPDSVIPSGGCSGPPPYVEPHDRVYLEEEGFAAFQASSHGELECTECHNGVDGTADKAEAHSGDFVKWPSWDNLESCSGCHTETVASHENSIHFNGWGQKRSQQLRAGVEDFHLLPEGIQTGYEQNCATCHASCGSCHVNRPPAGGGGLMDGHAFNAPDMRQNCTVCHSSRGGHAYYGVGTGTEPDVHLTDAGFDCMACHSTHELHGGDGTVVEQRYAMPELPSCDDCHTDISGSNTYHSMHMDDLNCHACHSQAYNTCGSCHVAGEGARIHSHQSFKIGMNPLPNIKPGPKYVTVRRTPAAPDTWSEFGVDVLSNFDAKPIYNYTTPHNILRWTERTQVADGESCYANCHIIQEGDTYRNRHLYLFSSDMLLDWEVSSTQNVFVDGQLPSSWGLPQ
jgi:thiosulfate/3-mercaptopyruvate sulfurtransferase